MNGFILTWKRVAADSVIPVGPGVYFVPVKGASLAARAAALSDLLPENVVIARRTAAWIWGLDVLPPGVNETDSDVELIHLPPPVAHSDPPASPHTASPSPAEAPSDSVDSAKAELSAKSVPVTADTVEVPAGHIVSEGGVRITSLVRTALDCARWLPRYEAVAALDQFLRRGVKAEELTAMARTLPGYRGSKRLREVVRLSDHGAASPGESWTRVAVLKTGFPRPETQVPVMGPEGRWLYIDLGYPEYRVGLEYDGERYHSGRAARTHDTGRRSWLSGEMKWSIISVNKQFLYSPAPYLEALLTAMLQRGWAPDDATMERIAARLAQLRRM
ncbi:hypothetical protein ACN3XK_37125 [Actinomadura welshii]